MTHVQPNSAPAGLPECVPAYVPFVSARVIYRGADTGLKLSPAILCLTDALMLAPVFQQAGQLWSFH